MSSSTKDEERGGSSSQEPGRESESGRTSTNEGTSTGRTGETRSEPRSYTVKPGDTLGMIAEETGVSIPELQELNPALDPQSLNVGDRIRLRR